MKWIKKHPYLTGFLIVGAFITWFLVRSIMSSRSASQSIQTGPTPSQMQAQLGQAQLAAATQTRQAELNAALTKATIEAERDKQVALITKETVEKNNAAASDAQSKDLAAKVELNKNANATQLQALMAGFASQNSQAEIAAAVGKWQAQLGAQVQQSAVNAGLTLGLDTNSTTRYVTDSNNTTVRYLSDNDVKKTQIGANVATHISDNDLMKAINDNFTGVQIAGIAKDVVISNNSTNLAINADNNNTKVIINGQNNATQQLGITTYGDVIKTGITTQGQTDQKFIDAWTAVNNNMIDSSANVALSQIWSDHDIQAQIASGLNTGVFNKGGEGGANQVSVAGGLLGTPQIGAPAQYVQTGNTTGATLGGVAGIISGAGQLFAGMFGLSQSGVTNDGVYRG